MRVAVAVALWAIGLAVMAKNGMFVTEDAFFLSLAIVVGGALAGGD